jgi:hypothetical protein
MLDKDQIEQLKKQYPVLYSVRIQGVDYIYRPLNIEDCEAIENARNKKNIAEFEKCFSKAILYPSKDKVLSGALKSIIKKLQKDSQIFDTEDFKKLISDTSIENSSNFTKWKIDIRKTLPFITDEELNKKSTQEFMAILQIAEKMSGIKFITIQEESTEEVEPIAVGQPDPEVQAVTREQKEAVASQAAVELNQTYQELKNTKKVLRSLG